MFPKKVLIRYGTRWLPSKREIIKHGPSANSFKEVFIWSRSDNQKSPDVVKAFPSFSLIDQIITDKTALFKWQQTQIACKGFANFKKDMQKRAKEGRIVHSSIEGLLKNLSINKHLPPLDKILEESDDLVHGYIQSVYPFLASLTVIDIALEKKVVHHDLFYSGQFDAVISMPNGPCLIDWKTANQRSKVAINHAAGDGLKGLYGYPKQVAAYIGAYNSDIEFRSQPIIQRGTLVIAFPCGTEAIVQEINRIQLEEIWNEWRDNLEMKFWKRIENGISDFIVRDVSDENKIEIQEI